MHDITYRSLGKLWSRMTSLLMTLLPRISVPMSDMLCSAKAFFGSNSINSLSLIHISEPTRPY